MSKLVLSTSMTIDALVDVGDWFVPEGGHDRLLESKAFDSGVTLLRYAPASV